MNNTAVKGGKLAAVLAGLLLIYKTRPYFFWSGIFLNNYFNAIITIIIGLLFFLNRKKMSGADRILMLLFGTIIISYPFVGDQNFNVFISILPLLFIPFATDEFNNSVYKSYLNFYCILVGLALFVWVFAIIGAIPPMKVIKALNKLKDYGYYVYPFLVRGTNDGIRFSGPFDEPGVIGTISGILLCCQKNFKSRQSLILLITGLCSISLFFYLIIVAYYSYSQLSAKGKMKNIFVYAIVAGLALIIIISSPLLNEMIISRLVWDPDSGRFAGDNRTAAYAWEVLDQIKGTHQFWFGIKDKWEFQEEVAFSSSFINVVIMNGALFFGLILIFYIGYAFVYKVTISGFLFFLFVLIATIYQRPYIFNPDFIFLWVYLARKESLNENMSLHSRFLKSKVILTKTAF